MDELELIYKKFEPVIYHYLYVRCEDSLLAEEITQETFFQIISKCCVHSCFVPERFFRKREPVKEQICRLAGQLLVREREKGDRELPEEPSVLLSIELPSTEYLPESYAVHSIELHEVREKIKQLEEPMRKVMYLKCYKQMTYKEVADYLHEGENWVRYIYRLGRERLAYMLKK